MFEFISKLSFSRGTSIALIIFGTIVAPYWFLFQFAQDIYKSNSLVQLLILSFAIGAPTAMIHYIMNFQLFSPEEFKTDDHKVKFYFSLLGGASILSGVIFYVPCMIKFLEETTQRDAIWAIIGLNGLFLLFSIVAQIIARNWERKDEKNKKGNLKIKNPVEKDSEANQ